MLLEQSNSTLFHWMPRFLLAPVLIALQSFGGVASADEAVGRDAPVVSIQVDLSKFAKSSLGEALIQAGITLAAAEMDKDPKAAMDAVVKSLGFNPLEQEIKINASVMDLEDPLDGLRLDVQLKDSTGNLEGLLLAAPEYRKSSYGEHTIHAATVDGNDKNVFAAFHTSDSGRKHITVAATEAVVKASLDRLEQEPAGAGLHEMSEGQFVSVRLLSMPAELSQVPPIATIGKMVNECSIELSEEAESLVAKIRLVTTSEEQATQIQQLAQGAVAMVGLFKEEIRAELGDEVFASNVIPILDQIQVNREGNAVTVETRIPESLVIEFLREEADLPL